MTSSDQVVQNLDSRSDDSIDQLADRLLSFDETLRGRVATAAEAGSSDQATTSDTLLQGVSGGVDSVDQDSIAGQAERLQSILRLLRGTLGSDGTRSFDEDAEGSDADDETEFQFMPPRVGRFRVGHLLGRGGFGRVYLAHDELLQRDVAIKAILRGPRPADCKPTESRSDNTAEIGELAESTSVAGTAEDCSRLNEARALAQLSHPHLVPLYEVIEDDLHVYLITQYCSGPTLTKYLKELGKPLPFEWAAELVIQIGSAVSHAHSRSLVHRDIKPSNILLFEHSDSSGILPLTARLTDFGLVRDLEQSKWSDADHRIAGTLPSMPPEQILQNNQWDARFGDIYSLGILLYQLLSGKLPFDQTGDDAELIVAICTANPPPLEHLDRPPPKDLSAITNRCLQKVPSNRYASVNELVDDLKRWRNGVPVLVRAQPLRERCLRQIRKYPIQSAMVAAVGVLALMTSMALFQSNRQLRDQRASLRRAVALASANESAATRSKLNAVKARDESRRQETLAVESQKKALRTAFQSDLRQAFSAATKDDPATALTIAAQIEEYCGESLSKRFDLHLLKSVANRGWKRLEGFEGRVEEVVFLPRQHQFVAAGGKGFLHFYDDQSGELLRRVEIARGGLVHSLAVSNDGQFLAVGVTFDPGMLHWTGFNGIEFYSLGGQPVPEPLYGFNTTVESLAFSPDDQHLAVGTRYRSVQLVDLKNPDQRKFIETDRRNEDLWISQTNRLTFTREFQEFNLIDLDSDQTTEVSSTQSGAIIKRFSQSKDDRWLACSFVDLPNVALFDSGETFSEVARLISPHGVVTDLDISVDNRYLVTGTTGGGVAVWDLQGLNDLRQQHSRQNGLPLDLSPVRYCVFHSGAVSTTVVSDKGCIVSGCDDGSLAMWKLEPDPVWQPLALGIEPGPIAWSNDGRIVYAGCMDGSIHAIDVEQRSTTCIYRLGNEAIHCVERSADGRWLVVGGCDGEVALVATLDDHETPGIVDRAATNVSLRLPMPKIVDPHSRYVSCAKFDASGRTLGICRGHFEFQTINLENGLSNARVADHSGRFTHQDRVSNQLRTSVEAFEFANEDAVLLIGDRIRMHRHREGEELDLAAGVDHVTSHCYDDSQERLFIGSLDGRIRELDLDGNIRRLSNHWHPVEYSSRKVREISAICLSKDGQNLLTGSTAGEIAIWDRQDLRYLGVIRPADGQGSILRLSLSADGRQLAWVQGVYPNSDDGCGTQLYIMDTGDSP